MRRIDGIINVTVRGEYLEKDNRNAGIQHEANVRFLRIDFDESWDTYGKTVTFWNALMGNPTKRDLTTDKLEDITTSTRIYVIPIPGEALDESGDMTFVIDGYTVEPLTQGSESLSIRTAISAPTKRVEVAEEITSYDSVYLMGRRVKLGDKGYTVEDAEFGPAGTGYITLDSEVERANVGDKLYASDGKRKRSLSDTLWVKPAPIELDASEPYDPTPTQAEQILVQLETIKADIQTAATSASDATVAADFAKLQANTATDAASFADEQRSYAYRAAERAEAAEAGAVSAKQAIENMTVSVETLEPGSTATVRKTTANGKVNLHYGLPRGEKGEKGDQGERGPVGPTGSGSGDMLEVVYDPQGKAQDIFKYTDDKIANIPAPDLTGPISAHNTDPAAHADMRTELAAVARAKTGGEIDQRLQNRIEKTGDKMTGILEFDTPGLFSAIQKKRTIGDETYLVRLGIGSYGTGGNISLRLVKLAADGSETGAGQFDIDAEGLTWVTPGGLRKTVAHSGNLGLLTASVE